MDRSTHRSPRKGIGLNANLNHGTPKIFMQMPPRFDGCVNFGVTDH